MNKRPVLFPGEGLFFADFSSVMITTDRDCALSLVASVVVLGADEGVDPETTTKNPHPIDIAGEKPPLASLTQRGMRARSGRRGAKGRFEERVRENNKKEGGVIGRSKACDRWERTWKTYRKGKMESSTGTERRKSNNDRQTEQNRKRVDSEGSTSSRCSN